MGRDESYINSTYDGLPISVLEIVPDGEISAVVYVVHGLCGCKERFVQFMEFLASHGIACVASDHRGHGRSVLREEDRGYMYGGGARAMVMDMDDVVNHICERFGNKPIVMVGHSMGSLAARAYMKAHDGRLDGLVICGSPSPDPMAPVGRFIVAFMCLMGMGRMRIGYLQKFTSHRYNKRFVKEGPQAWICSDPEIRRVFSEDARCNFIMTADCAATLMELFQVAYSKKGWNPEHPEMPVIFLSGADDPCMMSNDTFRRAVGRMRMNGYADVSCKIYPGMRHEILNEVWRLIVWEDILDYIRSVYLFHVMT